MNRKIIQIATAVAEGESALIMVLCDDGTAWFYNQNYDHKLQKCICTWEQLPAIPQDTTNLTKVR